MGNRTLVTGASGYIGSRLVASLLAAGNDVVAVSRHPERLREFGWYDRVSAVELDAGDAASARRAFDEAGPVDVVYYLVHGIGQPGFREADNEASATVAEAAKAAGVRRIVYLGGFVPQARDGGPLSEHLASRAEVAHALQIDGGPDVVWLGAAIVLGAGSTSFEMLRYVADRFLLLPMPEWSANPIDPISIRDVLYYLVAAADETVPAGSYDIRGPETTTYGDLLRTYARIAGIFRTPVPVYGIDTGLVSKVSGVILPVPGGLAGDLIESLDFPMMATQDGLDVPDPPEGLTSVEDAIRAAVTSPSRRPVDRLADPHHLADTDPDWAGGDALRLRQIASAVTPHVVHPVLGLIGLVPKPVAAAVRTGLDHVIGLVPRGSTA